MRRRMCACCLAVMSFITPWTMTVGAVPHGDHPGHIHGLT